MINYPDLFLHGQILNQVHEHKHLGIILSTDMKWTSYIDSIVNKGSSRVNGIRRLRHILTRKAKINLYQALVLPVLEYGSILYDNCSFYLKQ